MDKQNASKGVTILPLLLYNHSDSPTVSVVAHSTATCSIESRSYHLVSL